MNSGVGAHARWIQVGPESSRVRVTGVRGPDAGCTGRYDTGTHPAWPGPWSGSQSTSPIPELLGTVRARSRPCAGCAPGTMRYETRTNVRATPRGRGTQKIPRRNRPRPVRRIPPAPHPAIRRPDRHARVGHSSKATLPPASARRRVRVTGVRGPDALVRARLEWFPLAEVSSPESRIPKVCSSPVLPEFCKP